MGESKKNDDEEEIVGAIGQGIGCIILIVIGVWILVAIWLPDSPEEIALEKCEDAFYSNQAIYLLTDGFDGHLRSDEILGVVKVADGWWVNKVFYTKSEWGSKPLLTFQCKVENGELVSTDWE